MALQRPWGVTETATDVAGGVAVPLASPAGVYPSWVRIGNRDNADIVSVSWDGGATFPTTIPPGGYLEIQGRIDEIHVQAPPAQTALVEVTATAGDGH